MTGICGRKGIYFENSLPENMWEKKMEVDREDKDYLILRLEFINVMARGGVWINSTRKTSKWFERHSHSDRPGTLRSEIIKPFIIDLF